MGETISPQRREWLRAPGIEPLALRRAQEATGISAADTLISAAASPRLQLQLDELDPLAGEHAVLLGALVRALGLDLRDVCFDARDGLPVLAFGPGTAVAHVRAPALAGLRDARAKRALWPALRRLRGTLRRLGDQA